MISWPWIAGQSSEALNIEAFPRLLAWKQRIGEREAVQRALAQTKAIQGAIALVRSDREAEAARKVLFGQRAR
jgi:hypothetical protein